MAEDADYILDIGSNQIMPNSEQESSSNSQAQAKGRKYICVQFDCCNVYNRIYKNRQGTAYEGYCPRCGKKVTVRIGPGGVDARFFRAR